MRLPGFSAETSLYRSSVSYCLTRASTGADGVTLQRFALGSRHSFPGPSAARDGLLARGLRCSQCHLDDTGACVQVCTNCPPGIQPDGCTEDTSPCPDGACCPPGQDPCYVGFNQFCCPQGQSCCNPYSPILADRCCPQGQSCCNPTTGLCCPVGYCCFPGCCSPDKPRCCYPSSGDCCSLTEQCCPGGGCCPNLALCCDGSCCDPGQGQDCCGGSCADLYTDPLNCGTCGIACGPGQKCVNGQCVCSVVADPSTCLPSPGRTSSSNYFLTNNCQYITGLTVSLTATQDIVSDSGFTVQLNADSRFQQPRAVDAWQQYVFLVTGTSIQGVVNNWKDLTTAIVCGSVNVASTPISNGIPKGYTLQISLQYAGNSVSGALFEVLSNGQPVGQAVSLPVSQAGCNCNLGPGFTCTGYQGDFDLSPITAFQVNIVGTGNGASTTFTSGAAGNIQYAVSSGGLTAVNTVPACVASAALSCTAETSNAKYGQLLACPAPSMTQTFSI